MAILDATARYSHAFSAGDADAFAELFAVDGTLAVSWSDDQEIRVETRSAIGAWALEVFQLMPVARLTRMLLDTPVIDGRRDRVMVTCFLTSQSILGDTLATGILKFTLRSTKGNWQITEACARIDGSRNESAAREALAVARVSRRG